MEESGNNGMNCSKKRRKVLVPWRFQVGYVRRKSNKLSLKKKAELSKSKEGLSKPNDSSNLNGSTSNARVMSKLHKVVATWRFQQGYKRPFSKYIKSKDKVGLFTSPYNQRRYPTNVRIQATCKFSPDSGSNLKFNQNKNRAVVTRESLLQLLSKFQCIYRKLMDEEGGSSQRQDLVAYKIFRERNNDYDESTWYLGCVPGIRVGDVFHLRVELSIVGLHRKHNFGVDYIKQEDNTLAISIVSYKSATESRYFKDIDVMEFTGYVINCDARLDSCNLSLIRSMESKSPVRLIYGFIRYHSSPFKETRGKLITYIYCGLYRVERYWRRKTEDRAHFFYMFKLRRIMGQVNLNIESILNSKGMGSFSNFYIEDVSYGKEKIPVSAVNFIDNEPLIPFKYITTLKTSLIHNLVPPKGCNCKNGCSDSVSCACVVKNGGEMPFNNKGFIVEARPLVYECGPSCKCPPTCPNRVSQHGMKYRLQIFKTKTMGWGVRSLNFIPSGSFVCEYVGELLTDEEAQIRTNDEYLFAIGNNYYDEALWEGLKTSIPSLQKGRNRNFGEDEGPGFAIDAVEFGNVARFINHSCTPNLYAQNLLYDHDNKSTPRIMFFASENIQPLEELTYHYNYTIDQVHDAFGNVKKKRCYCGTDECTGWLY